MLNRWFITGTLLSLVTLSCYTPVAIAQESEDLPTFQPNIAIGARGWLGSWNIPSLEQNAQQGLSQGFEAKIDNPAYSMVGLFANAWITPQIGASFSFLTGNSPVALSIKGKAPEGEITGKTTANFLRSDLDLVLNYRLNQYVQAGAGYKRLGIKAASIKTALTVKPPAEEGKEVKEQTNERTQADSDDVMDGVQFVLAGHLPILSCLTLNASLGYIPLAIWKTANTHRFGLNYEAGVTYNIGYLDLNAAFRGQAYSYTPPGAGTNSLLDLTNGAGLDLSYRF